MSNDDITTLLIRWRNGDNHAKNELFELVYMELKKLSHKQLQDRDRRYLQTTELVHECFIKLLGQRELGENRGHFFKVVAVNMRRIILDLARKNQHDADLLDQPIDETFMVKLGNHAVKLIDVDRVLTRLATLEPRQAAIVEMRFFGGFKTEQIAEALEIGTATVKRDWQRAKAWIYLQLDKDVDGQEWDE